MRTGFATTWLAAVGVLVIGAGVVGASALRSCLGGTLHALQTLADGDRYGTMQHLMTVDGACRAGTGC